MILKCIYFFIKRKEQKTNIKENKPSNAQQLISDFIIPIIFLFNLRCEQYDSSDEDIDSTNHIVKQLAWVQV